MKENICLYFQRFQNLLQAWWAISVDCTPEMVLLQVTDDGRGFTPEAVRPDALGLGIMRERATEIGARLKIISEPGEGTSITLQWHAAVLRPLERE